MPNGLVGLEIEERGEVVVAQLTGELEAAQADLQRCGELGATVAATLMD